MKTIYPKYFKKFSCIAGSCPDTCCAGWEVVIDKKFQNVYKSSNTPAGKKAVNQMYTDSDGDVCLKLTNGRCPMLNADNLCEIYIDMGKESLCDVCKNYPRFFKESNYYTIAGISVSCPEAARIILTDNSEKKIIDPGFSEDSDDGIFFEIYNILTEIIFDGKLFWCNMEMLESASDTMIFNREKFCIDMVDKSFVNNAQPYRTDFAKSVICGLCDAEYLTKDMPQLMDDYKSSIDNFDAVTCTEKINDIFSELSNSIEIKNFAVYLLYKYLWEAIEEQSIELWIKRAYTMTRLACELCCFMFLKSGSISTELKQRICQLISKEFEHSSYNMELFDEFCI